MASKDLKVKGSIVDEDVVRYVVEKITVESALEADLRRKTSELAQGGMISGSDVGALLALLIKSIRARRAIEVGTFTGYTALKVAQALPLDGKLICCDIDQEWTSIGRGYWRQAGVEEKIDLRLGPATETLGALLSSGNAGAFDFVFIDADKPGYDSYYELSLELIRPAGVVVLDNMLWSGKVADPDETDESTVALRALGEKISRDSRVDSCLLTVGDGLMIATKK